MPWFVYAATGTLLALTVLNLLRTGRPLLGLALIFLFLTHRMLPLTYFNLLILAGFLLIAVDRIETLPLQWQASSRASVGSSRPGGINPTIV
jgi:hypothetical protein